MNRLLQQLRAGQPAIGTFTHLKSLAAIESLGYTGLDHVIIDTEHAPAGIDFVAAAILAATAAGISPLVRINEIARSTVLHALDAGAHGLIVPGVETVEEVRRLVRWAKFAPLGDRGYCPTRDGGWGYDDASAESAAAYMTRSNQETLLLPQCETAGCLAHIEEITAMEGVDGIFVGPMDLSIALGCPMELEAAPMVDALARIRAACKQAGKFSFLFCGNAAAAKAHLAAGFDGVAVGADLLLHIQTYRTLVTDIQA